MVGFDGSEMDDFGDGPSEEDVDLTHVEEVTLALVAFCQYKGWIPILMDGHTPGEQILGVSTGDGLDMSISVQYTP